MIHLLQVSGTMEDSAVVDVTANGGSIVLALPHLGGQVPGHQQQRGTPLCARTQLY